MVHGIVNLWQGELSVEANTCRHYWQWLDTQEKNRAESIRDDRLRQRYVEIRGRLRLTLAQWLSAHPGDVRIDKTAQGKPFLANYPALTFNISHTAHTLVVAAGSYCLLGVDIEQCKSRANLTGLVNKCFAQEEQVYWRRLPPSEQLSGFYRLWTRKEAFVKAIGLGIQAGLSECVVNPGTMNNFLRLPGDYSDTARWKIIELPLNHAVYGALVLKPQELNPVNVQVLTSPLPA